MDFNGKASRKEFWTFYFFHISALFVAASIDELLGAAQFWGLTFLALITPLLACGVRRMHDVDRSGWFLIIPFYNIYLLIKPNIESLMIKAKVAEEKRITKAKVAEEIRITKAKVAEEIRITKAKVAEDIRKEKLVNQKKLLAQEKTAEENRIKRIIDEDTRYKKSIAQSAKSGSKQDAKNEGNFNAGSIVKNTFKSIKKSLDDKDAARRRAMASIICPFCQTKGTVTTKNKQDTSGVKMTGAFFTFGLSTMVTGLNKHQTRIEARCSQCKTTWDMAVNKW